MCRCSIAAIGQVNPSCIDDIDELSGCEGGNSSIRLAAIDGAAGSDRERSGGRFAVAEPQRLVEDELGIIGEVYGFPTVEAGDITRLDIVEGERVDAKAPGDLRRRADIGVGEIAERCRIIVSAQIDQAMDNAAAVPGEGIGAAAHPHLTADRAAADTDIASDSAA